MIEEEWRSYKYGYEVSSLGRYRNQKGRLLKLHQSPNLRWKATVRNEQGRQEFLYIHVMVCEAFYGPKPDGMEVAHRDCDPSNNHLDNLRWATHQDNMEDCKRNGCRQ